MSEAHASAGVIVNAQAGLGLRDPDLERRLRERLAPRRVLTTRDPGEVAPALAELRAENVETLVLVGGDGTISGTLSELVRVWPQAEWPALVVTPGGSVNTIARSLGARAAPRAALDRLLEGRAPRETFRPLLRVRADAAASPRCGMIFGTGFATRWLDAYYASPGRGPASAARVVGRALLSAAAGTRFARRMCEPFAAGLSVDDRPVPGRRFSVVGAATVADVGLGFRPFHLAGEDPRLFHLLHAQAHPLRFALEIPGLRLGQPVPLSCLRHHSASRAALELPSPEPWMIDAEIQPPANRIEIDLTAPLRFRAF